MLYRELKVTSDLWQESEQGGRRKKKEGEKEIKPLSLFLSNPAPAQLSVLTSVCYNTIVLLPG